MKNGYSIEFESEPCSSESFRQASFSATEQRIISNEIEKLVKMEVLTAVEPLHDQFLLNIFLVPKHDGGNRLILNLKYLNDFDEKHHFKMEKVWITCFG